MERLPRTVTIGKHKIKVVLVPQSVLQEMMVEGVDEDAKDAPKFDGLWVPSYGQPVFGTVYILMSLKSRQRWEVFFHELIHAVNDLHAWMVGRTV